MVAGVENAGVRMPVETHRVAQARRIRPPPRLSVALRQHQHAAAVIVEIVVAAGVFVAAVAADAEAQINPAVGADGHGAARMTAGRQRHDSAEILAGQTRAATGPVRRAVKPVGPGDQQIAVVQRDAVGKAVKHRQHFGLRVRRFQPVDVLRHRTRQQRAVAGQRQHPRPVHFGGEFQPVTGGHGQPPGRAVGLENLFIVGNPRRRLRGGGAGQKRCGQHHGKPHHKPASSATDATACATACSTPASDWLCPAASTVTTPHAVQRRDSACAVCGGHNKS